MHHTLQAKGRQQAAQTQYTADPSQTPKQRQAIIEHTYGIIKRQWGFYFVSTKKGIKRASADVGLMFTAFNLRRLINIIDKNLFKQFLRELASLTFCKTGLIKIICSSNTACFFYPSFLCPLKKLPP